MVKEKPFIGSASFPLEYQYTFIDPLCVKPFEGIMQTG